VNIYRVISEELLGYVDIGCDFKMPEEYCITVLVRAKNHSQARYLAWQSDFASRSDMIRDMPKMSCHRVAQDVEGEPGVLPDEPQYASLWDDIEEAT